MTGAPQSAPALECPNCKGKGRWVLENGDVYLCAPCHATGQLGAPQAADEVERGHSAYVIAHDQAMSNGERAKELEAEVERFKALHAHYNARCEELEAEIERLRAGWQEAFTLAIQHQTRAEAAEARIEALESALRDARSDLLRQMVAAGGHSLPEDDYVKSTMIVRIDAALKGGDKT